MLLIGSKIPSFKATGINIKDGEVSVSDTDLLGQYTLLFFYSLDFSYVCPTEILALEKNREEFAKRNTKVIAISVDSIYTHARWLKMPHSRMGIEGVSFTLISDMSQKLSRAFQVFDEESGHSLRASFIVDEENIVQYGASNSFAFGRSIQEILRVIDAIQFVKTSGGTCPLNWRAPQA